MIITGRNPKKPANIRPHLDVKLAPGWHFDASSGVFMSEHQEMFVPGEQLPTDAEIRFTAPEFAKSKPNTLTDAERNLAAYVQIVFPRGASVKKYLAVVKVWPCVADAHEPPVISLP